MVGSNSHEDGLLINQQECTCGKSSNMSWRSVDERISHTTRQNTVSLVRSHPSPQSTSEGFRSLFIQYHSEVISEFFGKK